MSGTADRPASQPGPTAKKQGLGQTDLNEDPLQRARYGGLVPKNKMLPKDQKYFDSADWIMGKQKGGQPKLEPTQPPPRRNSQLGDNR